MKNEMNLRRKLYAALRKLTISWYKFILTLCTNERFR